ncbi:unnamed protein product [Schistosoma intercalatum]|nr:unnamed protein product [Schistosoma intercalatum]
MHVGIMSCMSTSLTVGILHVEIEGLRHGESGDDRDICVQCTYFSVVKGSTLSSIESSVVGVTDLDLLFGLEVGEIPLLLELLDMI